MSEKSHTRRLFLLFAFFALLLGGCGEDSEGGVTAGDDAQSTAPEDTSDAEDLDGNEGDSSAFVETDTSDTSADDVPVEVAQIELPAEPWDISKKGPYNIGVRRYSVTFEVYGSGEERNIDYVLWHPTRDAEGRAGRYIGFLARSEVMTAPSLPDDERLAKMPLLVFSHGNGGMAEQSYFMMEYFASHGWLVLSPDHRGNTWRDNTGGINFSSGPLRPQDISHLLDQFISLPSDDLLSGRVNTDQIVMSGHSFGAVTTLMMAGANIDLEGMIARCAAGELSETACQLLEDPTQHELYQTGFVDPRIKAFVPQTPGGYDIFREGIRDIELPVLMMTGGMDGTLSNPYEGDPIWAMMNGEDDLRVNIFKAGHFTFSDMCAVFPFVDMLVSDGCHPDFLPPEEAFPIINHYSMAFFLRHALNDERGAALLDGIERPYSENAEFRIKREETP